LLTRLPAKFYFGNEVDQVPAGLEITDAPGIFVTRLHESHEVSVYGAIERFVLAGEAVGLNAQALLGMLDQCMSLEVLLACIETQMEGSRRAA
jgi:hypothetical protein